MENNAKNKPVKLGRQAKYDSALANFAQREVPQQLGKKKFWWLTPLVLFISIGIGIVFIIQMSSSLGDEQKSFYGVFSAVSLENGLIAFAVLLGIVVTDVAKYVIILRATTGKIHPLIGAKTSFLGRYYDNITPFGSGGQPMQIYYLYKKGFSGGHSSAVVMIKFVFSTSMWLTVACICMACNSDLLAGMSNGKLLLIVGWIGWAFNALLPLGLTLFVTMPKLARALTRAVVFVGYKLKIIKDKQKVVLRAERAVRDFRSAFVIMAKSPFHAILLLLVCIMEVSLTFALPYFVIKMFNGFSVDEGFSTMFAVMALNAFAVFGASVIPTPGNSGVLEALITVAFSSVAGSTLMWVIFTWRFATFYLYIVIGIAISLFNLIRNLVRTRRALKLQTSDPSDVSLSAEVEFGEETAEEKQEHTL